METLSLCICVCVCVCVCVCARARACLSNIYLLPLSDSVSVLGVDFLGTHHGHFAFAEGWIGVWYYFAFCC